MESLISDSADFEIWLNKFGPENQQDKDDLIVATRDIITVGLYEVQVDGDKVFVSEAGASVLALVSEKTRAAFLQVVEKFCVPDDLELDYPRNLSDSKA